MSELNEWIIDKLSTGVVPVITHRNGDMDTIASSCALSKSLGTSSRSMGIHVSKVASEVIAELHFQFIRMDAKRPAWPRTTSGIIIVDSGGPGQIGINLPNDIPKCVIDHHPHSSNQWNIGNQDIHLNRDVRSTTQLVFEYLEEYRPDTLDIPTRKLLMTGLITDTGHYRHADANALRTASRMLGEDILHGDVLDLLRTTGLGRSIRIATLRSLTKVDVETAGDFVVAITACSTHEGVVASSLINAGADVSIVTNSKNNGLRLTTRASHRAVENGVDMGAILAILSESLGKEGGGHPGAAGWTTDVDRVEAVSSILSRISAIR